MARKNPRKPGVDGGEARSPQARATTGKAARGFTDEERAAMKERARELRLEARAGKDRAAGERAVLAAIAGMPSPDRALGERVHAIVTASAPALLPRLWYGMPAYANREGKVVCFFQAATKFKTRYATFSFTDAANLDDGVMWPIGFGLKRLGGPEEAAIAALVAKAVGGG
jgi:uncharacterized protein YdhG (YjbR/CyaY superfamily)